MLFRVNNKHLFNGLIAIFLSVLSVFAQAKEKEKDGYNSFSVQEFAGTEEGIRVNFDVSVRKTRDIRFVLQTAEDRERVSETMKRIKKSGKYHFDFNVDNLKPGKYVVTSYMAPRGKNWGDRIANQSPLPVEVVDAPKYVKTIKFAEEDKIKRVMWPKMVSDNKEVVLTVKFDISEPRELHFVLFNKIAKAEAGRLKYPVNEPGDMKLPLVDMIKNFPEGQYVWITYLTEVGAKEPLGKKYRSSFDIKKP